MELSHSDHGTIKLTAILKIRVPTARHISDAYELIAWHLWLDMIFRDGLVGESRRHSWSNEYANIVGSSWGIFFVLMVQDVEEEKRSNKKKIWKSMINRNWKSNRVEKCVKKTSRAENRKRGRQIAFFFLNFMKWGLKVRWNCQRRKICHDVCFNLMNDLSRVHSRPRLRQILLCSSWILGKASNDFTFDSRDQPLRSTHVYGERVCLSK